MNQEQKLKLENTYHTLPKRFYMTAKEADFSNPQIVIFNEKLADELGMKSALAEISEQEKAEVFSGKRFLQGTTPISQGYGGHQFGYFSVLGDGRAMLLGEYITPNGSRYDIHLKGSGATPYSRSGDGKAVLGPMLREYLISEAMYGLGIPTTRSLAVIATGEDVFRNGPEKGAVLARVASSHLRVGTFQFAFMGGKEDVQALGDYAIHRHYPEIENIESKQKYIELLKKVIDKQAKLIAKWQLVGFIHGVMNTDNMTISGETIDYGPCAFMDQFDPNTVFSSIDRAGRYAYGNQPNIGQWNLSRLGDALLPVIDDDQETAIKLAVDQLQEYEPKFEEELLAGMRAKLGIFQGEDSDVDLIKQLMHLMYGHQSDYTNTFVRLTLETAGEDGSYLQGTEELFNAADFEEWRKLWQKAQNRNEAVYTKEQVVKKMQSVNPFVIPRNYQVEKVLAAAEQGNMELWDQFLAVLQNPYHYNPANRSYQELPPVSMEGYQTFCGT